MKYFITDYVEELSDEAISLVLVDMKNIKCKSKVDKIRYFDLLFAIKKELEKRKIK